MNGLTPQYQCPECDELHEDHDDAVECCWRKYVHAVYLCPICKRVNHSKEGAIDCHGWEPPDPDAPYMPTPAELEAAGQLRLLP